MATIRKRNNKWQVQVRRSGFSARSRSFERKRDAELWAVEQERELTALAAQGPLRALECTETLDALLIRYCAEILPEKRSALREQYMINAMRRRPVVKAKAQAVTPGMFAEYRDQRLKEVRPASVVRELGVFHHLYEVARIQWGYSALTNPMRDVRKPRLPTGRSRRLSDHEERSILGAADALRNPYMGLIVRFALSTGMRASEILNARWDNLNGDSRTLLLPITKNGKPRTVPLSRDAMAALPPLPAQGPLIFPVILAGLRRIHRENGYITGSLINADLDLPHSGHIRIRFGTLLKAYEAAGLTTTRSQVMIDARARAKVDRPVWGSAMA